MLENVNSRRSGEYIWRVRIEYPMTQMRFDHVQNTKTSVEAIPLKINSLILGSKDK